MGMILFLQWREQKWSYFWKKKKAALFRLRVSSLRNEGTQEHLSHIMWSKINVSSPCQWVSGKNGGCWLHHSCQVTWTCLLPKMNQNEHHCWHILSSNAICGLHLTESSIGQGREQNAERKIYLYCYQSLKNQTVHDCHRMTKYSRLDGTLKTISFQLCAIGRDTFH